MPRQRASSTTSASSRVLPTPASPSSSTRPPWPSRAASRRCSSIDRSCSRPTKGTWPAGSKSGAPRPIPRIGMAGLPLGHRGLVDLAGGRRGLAAPSSSARMRRHNSYCRMASLCRPRRTARRMTRWWASSRIGAVLGEAAGMDQGRFVVAAAHDQVGEPLQGPQEALRQPLPIGHGPVVVHALEQVAPVEAHGRGEQVGFLGPAGDRGRGGLLQGPLELVDVEPEVGRRVDPHRVARSWPAGGAGDPPRERGGPAPATGPG